MIGAVSGSMLGDNTMSALRAAIDGLDARQQAITTNLANVETPGYHAREVSFEQSLRNAVAAGDPSATTVSVQRSMAPTRLNGNNVNLDMEIMASSENVMAQKLLVQSLNSKYSVLRTAITGA